VAEIKAEMYSCNKTASVIDGALIKSRVILKDPTITSIVYHLEQNENGIVHIGFDLYNGSDGAGNHEVIIFRAGN